MANIFTAKIITRFAAVCLMLVVAGSCTYDYFVDETNFRLYVPQIKNGEISEFYVAFHQLDESKVDGPHVITRKYTAPFDGDDFIREGILRFKLPPGEYDISTFADYEKDMLTEGRRLGDSYKGVRAIDGARAVYVPSRTKPRSCFLRDVTVYPLGHPDSRTVHEADINEECLFKGEIICRFEGLPVDEDTETSITDIRVSYRGNATRYGFDGIFRTNTQDDTQQADFVVADNKTNDSIVECSSLIFPSAGVVHGGRYDEPTRQKDDITLDIEFYSNGSWAGSARLTPADIERLAPTDQNGDPITELVLDSREIITIVFKGFTVLGIELKGWGDIETGDNVIH